MRHSMWSRTIAIAGRRSRVEWGDMGWFARVRIVHCSRCIFCHHPLLASVIVGHYERRERTQNLHIFIARCFLQYISCISLQVCGIVHPRSSECERSGSEHWDGHSEMTVQILQCVGQHRPTSSNCQRGREQGREKRSVPAALLTVTLTGRQRHQYCGLLRVQLVLV